MWHNACSLTARLHLSWFRFSSWNLNSDSLGLMQSGTGIPVFGVDFRSWEDVNRIHYISLQVLGTTCLSGKPYRFSIESFVVCDSVACWRWFLVVTYHIVTLNEVRIKKLFFSFIRGSKCTLYTYTFYSCIRKTWFSFTII